MPRNDKLTEKEASAARAMVAGVSATKACREAGYADPKGEGDRFLGKPRVRDFIIDRLQAKAVKWGPLRARAMNALDHNLSPENWEERDNLGKPLVSASDRNSAAKIVLELLAKIDPSELADRAAKADEADLKTQAERILDGDLGQTH